MKRARGTVGLTDGERMLRRLGEPDRLDFVLGRLDESTELREAHDQPVAIIDRSRRGGSEILVDPFGRQHGEVVGG